MLESIVLGVVQGITEWLPVSSQAAVTAAGSFLFDLTTADAIAVALWLHLGTALAAAAAFRREILALTREALTQPKTPSPLLRFVVVSVVVSIAIGAPLLFLLGELSEAGGGWGMVGVGVLMLVTAAVLARGPAPGVRARDSLRLLDALAAGVAQGLAALPGLSRSGLTVAALLGRRVDREEALALSFLIGIPATLGAGIAAGLDAGVLNTVDGLIGAGAALVVGFLTIHVLLRLARRVNFAAFVSLAGLAVVAGGLWQALA